jgi:hypothetical protein
MPSLEALLGHSEIPADDRFVLDVMRRVRRERLRRRFILLAFGLVGAVFAAFGLVQLSGPIEALFTRLPATSMMQGVLLAAGGIAFYTWFMGDDLGLSA